MLNTKQTEMSPEDIGYKEEFEKIRIELHLENPEFGRVVTEHKERYIIRTTNHEYEAELTGHMRFTVRSREDYPIVGDYVVVTTYDTDFALIHRIFPRFSVLTRQAVGQSGESQPIAANIDYAFIVQAVDRDFNLNRLERYLITCYASDVKPVILLSKTDLIDEMRLNEIEDQLNVRIKNVPFIAISNETRKGYIELKQLIEKWKKKKHITNHHWLKAGKRIRNSAK